MRRAAAAALLLALALAHSLAAAPALAGGAPARDLDDPRIRTVDYDPRQVVRVTGVMRTATEILFGADETIQHVALGDAAGWEVAAEGSSLFIRPGAARASTDLLVTTAVSGGEARHYAFELAPPAPSRWRGRDAVYVLRFRYPRQETAKLAAVLSAQAEALEQRVVALRLERAVAEGPRNLAYEVQGDLALAPSEVTDNGRFTVLRFPGSQPIPSPYAVAPDGSETLVPFDVRGEFLVLHQTGRQFRLRRGRAALCIFNLAWSPASAPPATGTAASDVNRTAKGPAR